jgi:hypothetical protein
MNEKPNEPTIEEIKEALAKITPGEWAVSRFVAGFGCPTITLRDHLDRPFGWSVHDEVCLGTYQKSIATIGKCRPWFAEGEGKANAAFIAGAPRYVRFLLKHLELTRGAMAADDARLVDAAKRAGVTFSGCDTAGHLADRILEDDARLLERSNSELRAQVVREQAPALAGMHMICRERERRISTLETALSDLMAWGVEHDNPGIGYITVQVDRAAVQQARLLLERKPVGVEEV